MDQGQFSYPDFIRGTNQRENVKFVNKYSLKGGNNSYIMCIHPEFQLKGSHMIYGQEQICPLTSFVQNRYTHGIFLYSMS